MVKVFIILILSVIYNLRGSFVIEGCLIVFGTTLPPNTSSLQRPVNGDDDQNDDDHDDDHGVDDDLDHRSMGISRFCNGPKIGHPIFLLPFMPKPHNENL